MTERFEIPIDREWIDADGWDIYVGILVTVDIDDVGEAAVVASECMNSDRWKWAEDVQVLDPDPDTKLGPIEITDAEAAEACTKALSDWSDDRAEVA